MSISIFAIVKMFHFHHYLKQYTTEHMSNSTRLLKQLALAVTVYWYESHQEGRIERNSNYSPSLKPETMLQKNGKKRKKKNRKKKGQTKPPLPQLTDL